MKWRDIPTTDADAADENEVEGRTWYDPDAFGDLKTEWLDDAIEMAERDPLNRDTLGG